MKTGYKVRNAYLQTTIVAPGTTFPGEAMLLKDKHPGISMLLYPDGLLVEQKRDGRVIRIVVPTANIKNVLLEEEVDDQA